MGTNAEVAAFYDTQAQRKLRDFVYANRRVECAWKTVCEWCVAPAPSRILEIGCGVGSVSWRLSRKFRTAEIVGVDGRLCARGYRAVRFSRAQSPNALGADSAPLGHAREGNAPGEDGNQSMTVIVKRGRKERGVSSGFGRLASIYRHCLGRLAAKPVLSV